MGGRGAAARARYRAGATAVLDPLDVVNPTDDHQDGDDQPKPLSRGEREAVSVYTGGSFLSINAYVQNGYRVPSYAEDDQKFVRYMATTVADLERAVNRSVVDEPTAACRATRKMWADQEYGPVGSKVGQIITVPRFSSTTMNPEPDRAFGDVVIRYQLAPGTKALEIIKTGVSCIKSENELLLGTHQAFRVLSDRIVSGQREIHMESVPPLSPPPPRTGRGRAR
jgi:ADP-ribosyltransferase exoenzyme